MSHEEITVTVVEFSDRKHYQMQYRDPLSGLKKTRSTGVPRTGKKRDRNEAERIAGEWERELRDGRYKPASKVTWGEFRQRYEDEVLSGKADGTFAKVSSVFNSVEAVLHLSAESLLSKVSESRLSQYQAKLREAGRAEDTIRSNLAHIGAALRWAARIKILREAPAVEMPSRVKAGGKSMKGRPITTEEYERMLAKVEEGLIASGKKPDKREKQRKRKYSAEAMAKLRKAQREQAAAAAPSWRHLLRGLWLSGLRLGEALELYWDRDDRLCVDLTGRRPMLRIPAELEKGHKDRLLPITPDFAEFLLATPEVERTGPVFDPRPGRDRGGRLSLHRVSRVISAIGEKAGVKVDTDATTGKVKYSSAHDLRRAFGFRWSQRVMPAVLKELMRHDSIDTTMKYYVGLNAERTADAVWEAFSVATGNTSGNSGQKETPSGCDGVDVNSCDDSLSDVVRGGIEPPTHGFSVRPDST